MRVRLSAFVVAAIVGVIALSGCEPTKATVNTVSVPEVVGMQLDKAQDVLSKAGFSKVDHKDRKGDRTVIIKSNWVVVDEPPTSGGMASTDAKVTLGVVKKSDEATTTTTTAESSPSSTTSTAAPTTTSTTTRPTTTTAEPTTEATIPPTTASSSVYYANCTAARAAGVAPLYRGDPGYRSALDRDGDGIACE